MVPPSSGFFVGSVLTTQDRSSWHSTWFCAILRASTITYTSASPVSNPRSLVSSVSIHGTVVGPLVVSVEILWFLSLLHPINLILSRHRGYSIKEREMPTRSLIFLLGQFPCKIIEFSVFAPHALTLLPHNFHLTGNKHWIFKRSPVH